MQGFWELMEHRECNRSCDNYKLRLNNEPNEKGKKEQNTIWSISLLPPQDIFDSLG